MREKYGEAKPEDGVQWQTGHQYLWTPTVDFGRLGVEVIGLLAVVGVALAIEQWVCRRRETLAKP